jgi:hypothetical protein
MLDELAVLKHVTARPDAAGIPSVVTGSLASGQPRLHHRLYGDERSPERLARIARRLTATAARQSRAHRRQGVPLIARR